MMPSRRVDVLMFRNFPRRPNNNASAITANVMRTALNNMAEVSWRSSTSLISAKVAPQTSVTRISRMWALTERDKSLGLVNRFSAHYRPQHFGLQDLLGRNLGDIAIKHDKIGEHARCECSFVVVAEVCECGAGGVGGDGLVDGQL